MDERKEYASDLWDMAKDEMPGTTPKVWIQEGKKDLDLLVEYGPEQYLTSRNAAGRRTGGCTCNGTIQFLKIPEARLAQGVFVPTKTYLASAIYTIISKYENKWEKVLIY